MAGFDAKSKLLAEFAQMSRRQGDRSAVVAVPRLIDRLLAGGHEAPLGEAGHEFLQSLGQATTLPARDTTTAARGASAGPGIGSTA